MGKWAGRILIGALVLESRCDAQHDSADSDWMRDMAAALTEQGPHPTIYGIELKAKTVVT